MPAGLFSLYIRGMAYFKKNPKNNKGEKYTFWVCKIVGVVAIGAGIKSLYGHIPMTIAEYKPWTWSLFDIAKAINIILLGVGFVVHYKKSVDLFARSWILVPMLLAFLFMIFKEWVFLKTPPFPMVFIVLGVLGILFYISGWFYYRKKYPKEFGLKIKSRKT